MSAEFMSPKTPQAPGIPPKMGKQLRARSGMLDENMAMPGRGLPMGATPPSLQQGLSDSAESEYQKSLKRPRYGSVVR